MSFEFTGAYGLPGQSAALETVENQFWWNRWEDQVWVPAVIEGAARDSGNTSYTDILRPGLLLGKLTSGGKLTEFDPAATDGSQRVYGILGFAQKMQRLGANQDRFIGWVMLAGAVKAANLLVPGSTTFGLASTTNEFLIRAQMHPRFIFDDIPQGNTLGGYRSIEARTADTTLVEGDNNVLFTNRGAGAAVNFTLPVTAKKGLRYGFQTVADFSLTVTAGTANTLVLFNDATGSTVAYATAGDMIGGGLEVIGDGTGWLVRPINFGDGVLVQTLTLT
jgi:hypothetical protein